MKGVQVSLFRIIHLNLTFCCYVLTPAKFHRRLRHHAKNFFDNYATKGFIRFIFNHETPLENRNMPQTGEKHMVFRLVVYIGRSLKNNEMGCPVYGLFWRQIMHRAWDLSKAHI